jgi:hypothetical protein
MKTNNSTKAYAIFIAVVFTILFFLLRGILEKLDWNNMLTIVLSLVFCGITAAFLAQLAILKSKTTISIFIFLIVAFGLLGIIIMLPNKQDDTSSESLGIELIGRWSTLEEEPYILNFTKDSLTILVPPGESKTAKYSLSSSHLKLYNQVGEEEMNWKIKFKDNRLIIFQNGDNLIFHKKD